ncbi:MAG TPA: DNA polymerase III subunit alpha, partial [Opitutales bacterium]|nr:DNA polymerase III subunit alpha [Opitutales bacterium]
LPFGENHYPVFNQPPELKVSYKDNFEYIQFLCSQGLMERYGVDFGNPQAAQDPELAQTLVDRIQYELGIINKTGFIDYFLIVWDFIDWARKQKIPVGPGRGSGAGCLVAYLLKITDIDPIRFGLLFERFLNPERVSPPDFDIDFCMRRRAEVIDYVRQKYGKDSVANIITFGTFGAKMVVRDLARVLDLPYSEGDRMSKMIPEDIGISLDEALEKSGELRFEVEHNPTAARIISEGKVIEGMVRNTGTHAAGIIVGDRPLTELVPVTIQEGALTTQFPKDPLEELGLLKIDFLGLATLTIIADAQNNIQRTHPGTTFDIEKVPLDDAATFKLIDEAKTVGVFQIESGGMQSLCRQLQVSKIDEIVALIALYRPGPMDLIPDYIRGKKDPSTIQYPHPLLEDVCRETYGIMVYQEQVMEAARLIAGYTLGSADVLRRAMGKKKPEEMELQRAIFIEGAKSTNQIPKDKAEAIFALLEKFAGYGFNKSHSAAYAILAYRTAYLKANYPVEFMSAVLSTILGNSDKVAHFVEECGNMG